MSKSIFLNLKDDNFWGNDDCGTTKVKSRESVESLDAEKRKEVEDIGWCDDDGWESVRPTSETKKNEKEVPAAVVPDGPFGGQFGGFSRTNASSYFGGNGGGGGGQFNNTVNNNNTTTNNNNNTTGGGGGTFGGGVGNNGFTGAQGVGAGAGATRYNQYQQQPPHQQQPQQQQPSPPRQLPPTRFPSSAMGDYKAPQTRPLSSFLAPDRQLELQANLLSSNNFTALDMLNAAYRERVFDAAAPPSAAPAALNDEGDEYGDDEWGVAMSLADYASSNQHPSSAYGIGGTDPFGSTVAAEGEMRSLPWSSDGPTQLNMFDDKYAEYYEYLCNGMNKMLNSGYDFKVNCEARVMNAPFQQPTICRALKAKYYHQYNVGPELYSRKVFVGGLPIDVIEADLISTFSRFGPLVVDWPNKYESKTYFPPKGYVFLIFDHEQSVRALVEHCESEDEKLFLHIHGPAGERLKVQVRPWRLADADYLVDVNVPVNLRRVVFVGGVPRPIRAVELAHMMDRLYGGVACAGIDTDVEFKYPKGAGRVAFTNYNSYMRAIMDRYANLSHGEVEKRVEIKPYVLDDQMCEECCGEQNAGRHAPFFCPHLECLQYYCESCWTDMHGTASREHHKPLVKEA